MSIDYASSVERPLANPIARFTLALFGFVPASLALLVLRLTLAMPFYKSGLTRWDGWFNLSFGTKALFADEYRLHVFGQEIPFPQPELVATMASTAEIVLPILLALRLPHPLRRARPSRHDRGDPAHLSRRLAELPSALGDDGAGHHGVGAGRDLDRPASRPRRLESGAEGWMRILLSVHRFG